LEFNNAFFSSLRTLLTPYNQLVYESPEQKAKPGAESDGGYLRIEFAERELKGEQVQGIYGFTNSDHHTGTGRSRLSQAGYRYSVPAGIKKEVRLPGFLLGNGIDVISAESLMLMHSPEVNFLTGFLRLLYGSNNVILLAELITYLYGSGKLASPGLHEVLSRIPPENRVRVLSSGYYRKIRFLFILTG
jgi:hypothetical protein